MPQAWTLPMSADPQETKLQAALSSCSVGLRECLEATRAGHELSFEEGLLLGGTNLVLKKGCSSLPPTALISRPWFCSRTPCGTKP